MLIGKAKIAGLIPHDGEMCLLDGVRIFNQSRIECVTETHRLLSNPLRRDGRLGILSGVEYAAQAMALHAALAGDETEKPRRGYLASLRRLSCHEVRLDQMPGILSVDAERVFGEGSRVIYSFTLRHEDRILLAGRAAVVLEI